MNYVTPESNHSADEAKYRVESVMEAVVFREIVCIERNFKLHFL